MINKKTPADGRAISEAIIREVADRLAADHPIRRVLPDGGFLLVDRPLPFLCIHRRPHDHPDPGTAELVLGEASYMIAPGGPRRLADWTALLRQIITMMTERFGAFLIIEIWSAASPSPTDAPPDDIRNDEVALLRPAFRLAVRGPEKPRPTVETLVRSLLQITVNGQSAEVQLDDQAYAHPASMPPLLSTAEARRLHCHFLGIEIKPIYRDTASDELFPVVLRSLRRGISRALKRTFFTFARTRTSAQAQHFCALGRRALVKTVWDVDRQLAEVGESFDLLWQVTPVNSLSAWHEFKRSGFQREPAFVYRPLAVEPAELKRRLFAIAIAKIDDPTLSHLFFERQDELDRQITMLTDIGTPRYLHGSIQVHGVLEPWLTQLAGQMLQTISPHHRESTGGKPLSAEAFAQRAQDEIDWYRRQYPSFLANVTIRDDLYWGLLVSGDTLMIGRQLQIPAGRAEPLLQHEVGTHLLTYFNGRAQPFEQLHCGLAGYDPLQEGLAVLAEHLSGSIGEPRLRLLAARVLACRMLIDGASFVDTFRTLHLDWGFPKRLTYTITMRVYRGGGTVKDATYLRGLVEILRYLGEGNQLEPLFMGKMAADHVPLINELRMRRVLRPAPLAPRYMTRPETAVKLQALAQGMSVFDLIQFEKRKK